MVQEKKFIPELRLREFQTKLLLCRETAMLRRQAWLIISYKLLKEEKLLPWVLKWWCFQQLELSRNKKYTFKISCLYCSLPMKITYLLIVHRSKYSSVLFWDLFRIPRHHLRSLRAKLTYKKPSHLAKIWQICNTTNDLDKIYCKHFQLNKLLTWSKYFFLAVVSSPTDPASTRACVR